jgi:AMP nucleosidase
MTEESNLPVLTPQRSAPVAFTDPAAAVARLEALYGEATGFLAEQFSAVVRTGRPAARIRAFYPEIRLTTTSFVKIDSRLSFGYVAGPGTYSTTVTRPDLFRNYLHQQIALLIQNHGVPVMIGASETPIPVHFAVAGNPSVSVPQDGVLDFT